MTLPFPSLVCSGCVFKVEQEKADLKRVKPSAVDAETQWRQLVKNMESWNRIVMNLVSGFQVDSDNKKKKKKKRKRDLVCCSHSVLTHAWRCRVFCRNCDL